MNTTEVGKEAENVVADILRDQKHEIIVQNWRTKWCEIDIISKHKNCVYFTEVKFRSSGVWGSGLDYITQKKLAQMQFAAEFWIHTHGWTAESVLQAAEIDIYGHVEIVDLIF